MNIKKTIILSLMIHLLILACAFGLNAKGAAIFNKANNYFVVSLHASAENKTSANRKDFPIIKKTAAPVEPLTENKKAREIAGIVDPSAPADTRDSHGTSEQINNIKYRHQEKIGQLNSISADINGAVYNNNLRITYGLIRDAIEKAKTYPLIAKKKMIQGTVVAEFSINPSGFPENMTVKKSSGSEILDAAAMKTIIKAAPFPYAEKRIEIPIKFEFN